MANEFTTLLPKEVVEDSKETLTKIQRDIVNGKFRLMCKVGNRRKTHYLLFPLFLQVI